MIVTEEEAKTKRCQESYPAAQVLTTNGALVPAAIFDASPMYAVHTAPTHCIGSACMAWRQRWRIVDRIGSPINDLTFEHEPKNLIDGFAAQAIGYCGKAGQPSGAS